MSFHPRAPSIVNSQAPGVVRRADPGRTSREEKSKKHARLARNAAMAASDWITRDAADGRRRETRRLGAAEVHAPGSAYGDPERKLQNVQFNRRESAVKRSEKSRHWNLDKC
jgi:hypothetical protein